MGLLERVRAGTFVPDDGPPAASPGRLLTLREAGLRLDCGEELLLVVRELLDQAGRADAAELAATIGERPELTGDAHADALIAGIAEHLACARDVAAEVYGARLDPAARFFVAELFADTS